MSGDKKTWPSPDSVTRHRAPVTSHCAHARGLNEEHAGATAAVAWQNHVGVGDNLLDYVATPFRSVDFCPGPIKATRDQAPSPNAIGIGFISAMN